MPPENQLPPHHAPTGLKLWLTVFAVVLVIALGYLVWAQNTAPDTTDNSAAVTKDTTTKTTTTNSTADWETYTDSDLGFSIKHPSGYKVEKTQSNVNISSDLGGAKSSQIVVEFVKYGKIGNADVGVKTLSNFDDVLKDYSERGFGLEVVGETTVNGRRAFTNKDTSGDLSSVNNNYVVEGKTGFFQITSGRSASNTSLPTEKDIILTFTVL